VSVVRDFPVQPVSLAGSPATSIGFWRLSSLSPVNFSTPKAITPREKGRRSGRKALRSIHSRLAALALLCFSFAPARLLGAQGEGLNVSDAWVPAADEIGRDVPLLVVIKNQTDTPDALMRVRCPVANFSEKHTVDRGEGAPAMRAISSIPIPSASSVALKPTEYHVMLLQIRQPLVVGERFNCALVFQKAGTIETEVEVRRSP
jgi:periplasmic copper chaperone A